MSKVMNIVESKHILSSKDFLTLGEHSSEENFRTT